VCDAPKFKTDRHELILIVELPLATENWRKKTLTENFPEVIITQFYYSRMWLTKKIIASTT